MGSRLRQYERGTGSAVRLGLEGFVLPMAKNIVCPEKFIGAHAPDLLKVLHGSSKPKEALGSVEITTIRKKLGAGGNGTFQKLYTRNTLLQRRVSCSKRTKKRAIRKKIRKPSQKHSFRQKKQSRGNGPSDAKIQRKPFDKEN